MTVRRAVVAVCVLLPACSGSSTSAPKPTSTTKLAVSITTQPKATITPPPGLVESLSTWSNYVAWVGQSSEARLEEAEPDPVLVHDVVAQTTRVLAKTRFRGGTIKRVRGHGEYVVFVDQATVTTSDAPSARWEIYLASLRTGTKRLVAASDGSATGDVPPAPNIAGPWIVWDEPDGSPEGGARIRAFNIENRRSTVLARPLFVGQVTVDHVTHDVFFDAESEKDRRDVYRVPVEGGTVVRVTSSGDTSFPIARNGGVVWQRPAEGDSHSIWYLATERGPAEVRITSQPSGSNAVPGGEFVVWADADAKLIVTDTLGRTSKAVATAGNLDTAARWSCNGPTLAFATFEGYGSEQQSTIHLVEVDIEP